jgi:NADH dehydrogenase
MAVQANVRVPWSVERALSGAGQAINLTGVLYESGRQRFDAVHETGARAIAEAARAEGVPMVHVSALGADLDSESAYALSKARGEAAVFETLPDAVVFRPSIVFGPEDRFFNRFANMARFSPVLPLLGGGHTRFQPVYVGDVAEAIARAVDGSVPTCRVYELGGPEIKSFRECMEEMLQVIERKRLLIPVPWFLARLQGAILGLLPNPLLTSDQVKLLRRDNIVSEAAAREGRSLEGLGIVPTATEAILASYLWRFRPAGQFTQPNAA